MYVEKTKLNYEELFKNLPRGVVVFDKKTCVYVNRQLARLFKVQSSKEFVELFQAPTPLQFEIYTEKNKVVTLSDVFLKTATDDGEAIYRVYFPEYLEEHWISVNGQQVNNLQLKIYAVADLTQQKKMEHVLRFLNKTSSVLSGSLDYRQRFEKFAELVVPSIADWCAIDMVGEDGEIERMTIAHADPTKVKKAYAFYQKYLSSKDLPKGVTEVIKTGKTQFTPEITPETLKKTFKGKSILKDLLELHVHSVVIVPLITGGRTIGAVTFIWSDSGKKYDQFDVNFLEMLCHRVALLIDNARLFDQSQHEVERQKSIQQQLRQQEETLRLALQAGNMGVWDWDIPNDVLIWSEGLEKIHGLEKGEFSGKFEQYQNMIHVHDLKHFSKQIADAVKKKSEFSSEFRVVWKDQSIHWMLGRGKMFSDDHGKPARMVGIGMDITEKKIAEEKLKQSEKKFKAIFDTSLDGIVITDSIGKIIEANDSAKQLFRMDTNTLLTKNLLDLISVEEDKAVGEMWSDIQKLGQQRGEFQVPLEDGSVCIIEYNATAEIFPNRTLLMLRDVSDRKAEEKRQEHFLGIASHELKNPLASIKAFVQLLKRYLRNTEDEKIQQYLEKVDAKADSLGMLINDLLDITRIRQGKLEFFFEFFNFDQLLADVIEDIRVTSKSHTIELKGKTNIEVMADKNRIVQVMQNIIRNAIKYSPDADKVVVSVKANSQEVTMSVRDYGIGIAKSDEKRIFQLYYRGLNHKKDNIYGLGVGLYISSQIIKQHGGKIWAKSEEGKGTTFYVTLPLIAKRLQES